MIIRVYGGIMKAIKFLFVNLLLFVILLSSISPALSQNETATPTATPTVTATTAAPTATATPTVVATTAAPTAAATPAKFRVGPTVRLRPVTDVIERTQDGIVEIYMDNPSLNDVTLKVEARVSVPSGIHVYGQSFGQAGAAGIVMGTFEIPPGGVRTINVAIKADKSARIGSHSLQFTGLYWPDDNKDNYQPISLTYGVTVKEASEEPEKPPAGTTTAAPKTPGFISVLALVSVLGTAYLLSRKT